MNRVVVESPFNPPPAEQCVPWTRFEVARQNLIYARLAMLDSLHRGESPFLSHLLYTQVWSEEPSFRARGIAAGLAQHEAADIVAFYVDLGISPGMQRARDLAGPKAELRSLCEGLPAEDTRDWLSLQQLKWWPLLSLLERELEAEESLMHSAGRSK